MAESENLATEISEIADVAFSGGRTNHMTDLVCSIGAIVASFAAAVMAAAEPVPGWVTAIVAAVPGLCASLQRVIDFRGRAAWYFLKAAQLTELSRNLKYAAMPVADGARRLGELERMMEERWAEFVKAGSAPSSKS